MEVPAVLKAELSWLQRHEKLVLTVLSGLILWFAIGKIDTLIINHDAANLQQAKVVAQAQENKNATLAEQAKQQAAQYEALAERIQQQNDKLAQANTQLASALTKQQHVDATLPPTELAQRWNTLVPSAKAAVSPNGEIALPTEGAVATVQQLEEVPVLTQQLSNSNEQRQNVDNLLNASRTQVGTLNEQVDGLKLQIVDNDKVCKAQVAEVKAQARKGKRTWFTIGYVAGLATRGVIRILAGF